jgi:hypothetical protein
MAHATGRIGTGGTFLGGHDVEPNSRARMLSQDRTPVYLLPPGRPAMTADELGPDRLRRDPLPLRGGRLTPTDPRPPRLTSLVHRYITAV